ncbi:hypothetical protein EKO27_g6693 [Xylaria grammica]|uniref:Uncharacterized protein n=1 Tax=Xylaria grammica TaxID=363999 RepID=A0A439D1U3_9PEZI|nr:hypothetical protein EKO27_g6693 [Xylaria grammica]
MRTCTIFQKLSLIGAIAGSAATCLNFTAISTRDNTSHFECWQLSTPFTHSNQPGIAGTASVILGDVTNITYNVIPAGYDSRLHTVPSNQWAIVLNGVAIITLADNSTTSVTTDGGESGVLFFEDTATVSRRGHGSFYPGITETIFLQIPTKDGIVPEHEVLSNNAPCKGTEFAGLRGMALPDPLCFETVRSTELADCYSSVVAAGGEELVSQDELSTSIGTRAHLPVRVWCNECTVNTWYPDWSLRFIFLQATYLGSHNP